MREGVVKDNHIFVKWFVGTATCSLIVAVLWPGSLALSWSVGYYHEHTYTLVQQFI